MFDQWEGYTPPPYDFYKEKLQTWYCQFCFTTIARRTLNNETCRKCGGMRFALQPPLHSTDMWELTEEDKTFLRIQKILPT